MEEIKINNNIKEDHVSLYNPKGKLIGIIKNELAFNDVRIQIKNKKIKGYYIVWEGQSYQINSNGKLDNFPFELYRTYEKQLCKLIGL